MEMEEINYLYLYLMLIFRSELTEVRMQQLQMIRGSPSYADRLADNISQKLRLVQKVSILPLLCVCLLQLPNTTVHMQ